MVLTSQKERFLIASVSTALFYIWNEKGDIIKESSKQLKRVLKCQLDFSGEYRIVIFNNKTLQLLTSDDKINWSYACPSRVHSVELSNNAELIVLGLKKRLQVLTYNGALL